MAVNMEVFLLVSVLCIFFTAVRSAPAEVFETLPEEQPQSDNTGVVNNVVEPIQVEPREEVAEDDEALPNSMALCPPDWISSGSHCYKAGDIPRSWESAEEYCVAYGGHLASAESFWSNNNLQTMVHNNGFSHSWTGGYYFRSSWRWVDGTYYHWRNWDTQSTASSYPCIYMKSNGGWVNTACTSRLQFICMRRSSCY